MSTVTCDPVDSDAVVLDAVLGNIRFRWNVIKQGAAVLKGNQHSNGSRALVRTSDGVFASARNGMTDVLVHSPTIC